MKDEEQTCQREIEQWLAVRKEAALKIDPNTAEVKWEHGSSDLAARRDCWVFFARAPVSDVWVSFDDLPDETCKALWRKLKKEDPLAPTLDVVSPNGSDRWEQTVILMAEEYPELFSDIDEEMKALDRMVEEVSDETRKARWRSGRARLEKLNEVLKRKAAGLQLDS
jgi:hypothetical protein